MKKTKNMTPRETLAHSIYKNITAKTPRSMREIAERLGLVNDDNTRMPNKTGVALRSAAAYLIENGYAKTEGNGPAKKYLRA